jgi:hypothetical protein
MLPDIGCKPFDGFALHGRDPSKHPNHCPKSLNIAQTMAICIDLRRILHAPFSTD